MYYDYYSYNCTQLDLKPPQLDLDSSSLVNPEENSYENPTGLLKSHFQPELLQLNNFHQRNQHESELINYYELTIVSLHFLFYFILKFGDLL